MKEVLRDAVQASKSLMSSGSTATSSSSTLEGLQRQLDELKLKALSVKNEAVELRRARRTPLDVRVEEGVPTLIDSGATHILRQPRDGAEMASATRVSVTLANDEGCPPGVGRTEDNNQRWLSRVSSRTSCKAGERN